MKVKALQKLFFNNVTYYPERVNRGKGTIPAEVFHIPEKYADGDPTPVWSDGRDEKGVVIDEKVAAEHDAAMVGVAGNKNRKDGLGKKGASLKGLPKAFNPRSMEMVKDEAVTPKGTKDPKRPLVGGGSEVAEKPEVK